MRASEVPSGWTVASMLEHLVGAEEHWCEYVLTGHAEFRTGSVSDRVVLYQAQGQRSDRILATVALDARPAGTVPPHMTHDITTTRDIILH